VKEFDPRITEALARLPEYLGNHVLLSISALTLGIAISLPFGILAARNAKLRWPLLAVASLVQTIPGLALLALFYPLLLGISSLTAEYFNAPFSAFGFLPSLLALTLYSMLPVLRNTITGLNGIDPAVLEAAQGAGMTTAQSRRLVELPLAMPVIMAGIRTAAVWVIGTATLSTPVGQTSLGNYIFTGLQTQNWVFVLFGCLAAAALALAVDQLLALVESGARRRKRIRIYAGLAGLLALVSAALAPGYAQRGTGGYVIGSKTFTEQFVLAALIRQRLEAAGVSAIRRDGLGSTVAFDALANDEIDVYVDYSGTIWANQMLRKDMKPREEVLEEMRRWLAEKHGITLLGSLGFENAYAFAMRRERAAALNIRTVDDLARHARQLSVAGDFEFFARPEWPAVRDAYGLQFRERREMQSTFMYEAAAAGEADVITAFSSDGRIRQYDLVVLEDPRNALPPYDAILLLAPKRAKDEKLISTLRPLIGAIDVETMRAANLRSDRTVDKETPAAAARWLNRQIGKR
jgi:osmoprotectant transport system permease protein